MIPGEISLSNPSAAEKKLFKQLAAVEVAGLDVALHSLNLSEHLYKELGEIDFLLVGPRGLYVLEVKGGRVACRGGVWIFTDRYGCERRKSEGPFEQAKSAMYSLLDRLRELGATQEVNRATHGFGVVIPDQQFSVLGVEWSPKMVLDEPLMVQTGGLRSYLRNLLTYWEDKRGHATRVDPLGVERLLRLLRPEFELVPTLSHFAREIDEQLAVLTEQQYRYLDASAKNARLLCAGGAGTGKTFLAAEVARRELAAGRRVLLTCASPIFAAFLRRQLEGTAVEVQALIEVAGQPDGTFDSLVVDEGQDVINHEDLVILDRLLVSGLSGGRWRIFYDVNNQTGLVGSFDVDAFSLLLEVQPTQLDLPDNCRNTRRIVDRTRLITGADLGVTTAGGGPDVQVWFHPDRMAAATALADHLDFLLDAGIPMQDVAVLTSVDPARSAAARLPAKWRSRLVPLDTRTAFPSRPGDVVLARITDFKGLERRFVAVIDIDRLETPTDISQLYVAMTRPRAGLWLSLSETLRGRVEELAAAHAPLFATGP